MAHFGTQLLIHIPLWIAKISRICEKYNGLDKDNFRREVFGSLSNCIACYTAKKGSYDDHMLTGRNIWCTV